MSFDENHEDDESLFVTPNTNHNNNVADLQKIVKESQLKEIRLEEQLKELTIRNAALKSGNPSGRRKKGNAEVPDVIAAEVDTIGKLGKKCCVFLSPWLSPSLFKRPNPPGVEISGPSRYLNAETREEALIAELYQFVPTQHYMALEKLATFGDIFRGGMSAMRSTTVYTLRPHCSTIFESLDASFFKVGFNKIDNDELKRLAGWDKKLKRYHYWAPILFQNPDSKPDLRYAFRNKSLPLILRVILFGASSLSTNRRATPKTNGQIWGVTSINDSAIAYAAILARFIMSGDTEFVETGNKTNIDYLSDFWAYRQFLAKTSEAPHDALIKWYNKRVFVDKNTVDKNTVDLSVAKDADEDDKIRDDDIAAFNEGVIDDDDEDKSSICTVSGDETEHEPSIVPSLNRSLSPTPSPYNNAESGLTRHATPRLIEGSSNTHTADNNLVFRSDPDDLGPTDQSVTTENPPPSLPLPESKRKNNTAGDKHTSFPRSTQVREARSKSKRAIDKDNAEQDSPTFDLPVQKSRLRKGTRSNTQILESEGEQDW